MASERAQAEKRRAERGNDRRLDQIVLAVFLIFIPLSLFLYVGFQIAVATGADPYAYVPAMSMWEMLMGMAMLLGVLVVALAVRGMSQTRESKRAEQPASRWDNYQATSNSK